MKIKKQYLLLAAITLIVVIIASFGGKCEYYDRYKHYKYAYFPHYSSINNPLSQKDSIQADKIIEQAREVFTFKGDKEPVKDVGKLKRYYHISPYTSEVELSLEPIAGDFSKNNGFLWVVYSVKRTAADGEILNGSWDILSYWQAKKQDDGSWKVVKIKEAA